jgi:predicted membrane protein
MNQTTLNGYGGNRVLPFKMKPLSSFLLLLVFLFLGIVPARAQWNTAYYATWNQSAPLGGGSWNYEVLGESPSQVDWTGITHVVHFGNGNVVTTAPYSLFATDSTEITHGANGESHDYQTELITVAHSHGVKVMLSIQAVDPTGLHAALASQATADVFAEWLTLYAKRHGYDGFEIDWEGESPNPTLANRLILTLRAHLNAHYGPTRALILLSPGLGDFSSYTPAICDTAVDQYNIQLYAMMWTPNDNNLTWHETAVYPGTTTNGTQGALDGLSNGSAGYIQQWISGGHDPSKVGMLLPTFGYVIKGADGLFQSTSGGVLGHNGNMTVDQNSFCTGLLKVGGTMTWDAVRQASYISGTANAAYAGPQGGIPSGGKFFATLATPQWVQAVVQYYRTKTFNGKSLGGLSLYSLTEDFDPTKPAGAGRNYIHDALRDALGGVAPQIVTTSVSSLPGFGSVSVNASSASASYTVSGSNLTSNVLVSAPTNFQVSLDNTTFSSSVTIAPTSGTVSAKTVYVRFTPTASGALSGYLSNTSGTATAIFVSVSGTGTGGSTTPAVTASVPALTNFGSVNVGSASTPGSYTVSGTNLAANIAVTAPANFQVSLDNSAFSASVSIAPSGGTVSATTVYVRFSPTSSGGKSGNVTNVSGTSTASVAVSGTGVGAAQPAVTTSVTSLASFGSVTVGASSGTSSYTVSGSNLTANIVVTAPTDFQVSLDSATFSTSVTITQTAGTVSAKPVYVRFAPASAGAKSGFVSNASGTTASAPVAVSGTGVTAGAPTGTFTASPTSLPAGGGSVKLTWTSTNASSASIDQGVGTEPTSGSTTVTVTTTKTFTLTLTNANGTKTYTATATVAATPAPTGSLTANPTSLPTGGGSVTLTWKANNTTTAKIDQGIGTVSAAGGSQQVNVTSTRTYTLTLTNSVGTKTYSATVTVAATVGAPTGTLTANPASLPVGGGNVVLRWTSANATTAAIDQGIGTVTLNGSQTVAVASTSTFTISFSNASGTRSYSATVSVDTSVAELPALGNDITQQGTPIAAVPVPGGAGNPDLATIKLESFPAQGSSNVLDQYDTFTSALPPFRAVDWVGYSFSEVHSFTGLLYQKGLDNQWGGCFNPLSIQVHSGGAWQTVTGRSDTPAYVPNDGINFETYAFSFDPVQGDAIRIYGPPTGQAHYIGVARLRAYDDAGTPPVTPPVAGPKDYGLDQNYPNPFNPATHIAYKLPGAMKVTLIVRNLLGQQVAMLVNAYQGAGVHSADFSGDHLASGVYFAVLITPEFRDMRKMILVH